MMLKSKFKLGDEVVCAGRPAYIVGIQYGPKRYQKHSPYDMTIRYEISRDIKKLTPDFIVDSSQVWDKEDQVTQPIQLVK